MKANTSTIERASRRKRWRPYWLATPQLIAGLFSLAAQPLISVLEVLGGMALSLCSATELVHEPSDPNSVTPSE